MTIWRIDAFPTTDDEVEGLKAMLAGYPVTVLVEKLADADWLAMSLSGLPPVEAGRFFVYGAHDQGKVPEGRVTLKIDAGAAFGTGHHGTTVGCLEAFDKLLETESFREGAGRGLRHGRAGDRGGQDGHRPSRSAPTSTSPRPGSPMRTPRSTRPSATSISPMASAILASPSTQPYDLVFANILAAPLVHLAPEIGGGAEVAAGSRSCRACCARRRSGCWRPICRWVLRSNRPSITTPGAPCNCERAEDRSMRQTFDETTDPSFGAKNLPLLRAEMAKQGLDGFLIPHEDEHQNEYLPDANERLAWATGFTGSAGAAVVFQDRASMFTDGRYTVQVKAQTDPALFERRDLNDVAAYLETAANGAVIGYDPRLHSPDALVALQGGGAEGGGRVARRGRQSAGPGLGRRIVRPSRRRRSCRTRTPIPARAMHPSGRGSARPWRTPAQTRWC